MAVRRINQRPGHVGEKLLGIIVPSFLVMTNTSMTYGWNRGYENFKAISFMYCALGALDYDLPFAAQETSCGCSMLMKERSNSVKERK
jgi:hypothetical protein